MRRLLMLLLAGVGAAGLYLYVADKLPFDLGRAQSADATPAPAPPKETPAPAVTVMKVTDRDFREIVLATGSLVAREEILVSPEIEGFRVMSVNVDEGSRVKKGDVLATLVSEQLDAQLAQNDASLVRATAAIAQAKSQIVEAEARVTETKAALERAMPLRKSGYLADSEFDQRNSAAKTAAAQLVSARDGLRLAEAERTQIEAQRRELQWRRGNTEVKAPADGVICRRTARIGALASSVAEPLFRIIEKGEIELDAEVVETDLVRIREGQRVRVTVPGSGEAEGVVRLVSPEVDKTTRLGRVRVFLGEQSNFRIGAFARGVIETASSHGPAVPSSAIFSTPEGETVQLVRDNKIVTTTVKSGLVAGDMTEIVEGVAAGDIVVSRAGPFLRDGDTVRPVFSDAKVSEAN
jgi:HlyD family secretion protein